MAGHFQRSIRAVESSLLHRVAPWWVVFLVCATIATPFPCCWAFQACTLDLGGGICPEGNTCCRKPDGSSGCIASDMGKYNATCCNDGEMKQLDPMTPLLRLILVLVDAVSDTSVVESRAIASLPTKVR
jgi:hypothetical protein